MSLISPLLFLQTNSITLIAYTIFFEAGLLGFGTYLVFVKIIPHMESWRDYAKPFAWSKFVKLNAYYLMRGIGIIILVGVLGLLLTSTGWRADLWYNLLFARSSNTPDGAHLVSYLPVPILGLYVAWKFRTDFLLNTYLGLLVADLAFAIHEGIWIVFYYAFYWEYLTWGVLPNVAKDVFFVFWVAVTIYAYQKFPLPKIPLKVFKWPTIIYTAITVAWALDGFHISTINNPAYGTTIYMVTRWWADPATNAWEVLSWVSLLTMMGAAIWLYYRR